MNNRPKEAAYDDFIETMMNCWTYQRLTSEEKERLFQVLESDMIQRIKGSYANRINQLNAVYFAFLMALNYEPVGWRENQVTTWTVHI